MFSHIAIEIILAIIAFFAAYAFWEFSKRAGLVKRMIHDQAFLETFISKEMLTNPSPAKLPYLEKNQGGYLVNIAVAVKADSQAQRLGAILFLAILIAVFVGSYFLGVTYLCVNVTLFFVAALMPVSPSTERNAMEQIATVASILYRWNLEDSVKCCQWIERAQNLTLLYTVVKEVSQHS